MKATSRKRKLTGAQGNLCTYFLGETMQIKIQKRDGTTFKTNVTALAKAIYPHVTADTSYHYSLETDFINGVIDAIEQLIEVREDER
jgi:hypothetical protein